jgi:hypothetical protein
MEDNMITLEVRQSVADFDTWKSAFDGNSDARKSHGATKDRVFRDGNDVLVLIDFPDEALAQKFLAASSLAQASTKGGVLARETRLLSEVEEESS